MHNTKELKNSTTAKARENVLSGLNSRAFEFQDIALPVITYCLLHLHRTACHILSDVVNRRSLPRGQERFAQALAHGRVREDRLEYLLRCQLRLHRRGKLGDHFRRMRTEQVYAENFAVLAVQNDLHHTIRAAVDQRLAVRVEREAADFHIVAAALSGLRFGQADARDLGLHINAGRDAVIAHRALTAANVGNSDLCLLKGGVRQHGLAVRVADHIDVVDAALEALVAGDGRTGIRYNNLCKLKRA